MIGQSALEAPQLSDIACVIILYGALTVDAVLDDAGAVPHSQREESVVKPNFDMKDVVMRLNNANDAVRYALLKGIHDRFWHATAKDMSAMLHRAGVVQDALKLIPDVVRECEVCRKYSRAPPKPRIRAELAGFFNDIVYVDLFFVWGKIFMLIIDEATRYKVSSLLRDKTGHSILRCMLMDWMRYFGPMRTLVSDQEGGLRSDESGARLEKLSVQRRMKGSDQRQEHTGTGLVERHVALQKLTMLKMKAECDSLGLVVEHDEICAEAAMAQNLTLSFGGYTPAQAAIAHNPRAFYEIEDSGLLSVFGALESGHDFVERSIRFRTIAAQSVLASIVEDRLARANLTRPHKMDPVPLVPGTQVDILRIPDNKTEMSYAWKGPGDLLEIDLHNGTCIVKWQSIPYMIPIRHVRPHVIVHYASMFAATRDTGLDTQHALFDRISSSLDLSAPHSHDMVYHSELSVLNAYDHEGDSTPAATDVDKASMLLELMLKVTRSPADKIYTVGSVRSPHGTFVTAPKDPTATQVRMLELSQEFILRMKNSDELGGIRFGSGIKRITSLSGSTYGILVLWHKEMPAKYEMREIRPDMMVNLLRVCGASWPESCFLLFYFFVGVFSEDTQRAPQRMQSVPPTHFDDDDGMHSPDVSMRTADTSMHPGDSTMLSSWPSPISMEQSLQGPPGPPGPPGSGAAPMSPPAAPTRRNTSHDISIGVHKRPRWPPPRGQVRPAGQSFEKPSHSHEKTRRRMDFQPDSPSAPMPPREESIETIAAEDDPNWPSTGAVGAVTQDEAEHPTIDKID